MANRTDPLAKSVHGTNPQNLIEQILRTKIYNSRYWKEECFGLSAETLVDKAVELRCVGGTFGGQRKPTDFMCLLAKMLQIQPDKEIIVEFIKNEEYKYVRLLGAFYLRLVGKAVEVYQYLEPLYNDYRKIRKQTADGGFGLTHVDDVVDEMLTSDYMFDIAMPRIPARMMLERSEVLDARVSVLAEDFDEAALEAEAGDAEQAVKVLEAEMGINERERGGRDYDGDRDRARPRDRERHRRHRSRSRSHDRDRHGRDYDHYDRRERRRSRERSERDRSRDKERSRRRDRDYEKDRSEKRPDEKRRERKKRDKKHDEVDPEIAEANALRAKLGLKPLK